MKKKSSCANSLTLNECVATRYGVLCCTAKQAAHLRKAENEQSAANARLISCQEHIRALQTRLAALEKALAAAKSHQPADSSALTGSSLLQSSSLPDSQQTVSQQILVAPFSYKVKTCTRLKRSMVPMAFCYQSCAFFAVCGEPDHRYISMRCLKEV